MHRLNVRCCCQPQKILGTLEVRSFDPVQKICWAERHSVRNFDPAGLVAVQTFNEVIEIKPFGPNFGPKEMAVYSDDRPIEFWRKVPGFIEAAPTEDDEILRWFTKVVEIAAE